MTQISKIYDGMSIVPIDRVAARVLFNQGWFNDLPKSVSDAVIESVLSERMQPEKITIDYFRKPEINGSTINKRDMRGRKVFIAYNNGVKITGTVTGFCYIKEKVVTVSPSSARSSSPPKWWNKSLSAWNPHPHKKRIERKAVWWVLGDRGFRTMTATAIERQQVYD